MKNLLWVHYIGHVPFEGIGSIAEWIEQNGFDLSSTRVWEEPVFPKLDDFDLLIVMGGPMSVNDETDYPWLAAEKAFIRSAIDAGKKVIGFCLGAQLIAASSGMRVYAQVEKEIGWFPVRWCSEASPFTGDFLTFHWHGETFDLPQGAELLASSVVCENQAFKFGNTVIGFQFHPEVTPESVAKMISNCGAELVDSRYIQSAEEMTAVKAIVYDKNRVVLFSFLDKLVKL